MKKPFLSKGPQVFATHLQKHIQSLKEQGLPEDYQGNLSNEVQEALKKLGLLDKKSFKKDKQKKVERFTSSEILNEEENTPNDIRPVLSRENINKYNATSGQPTCCPRCHAETDPDPTGTLVEGLTLIEEVSCRNCNLEWQEVYYFSHITQKQEGGNELGNLL